MNTKFNRLLNEEVECQIEEVHKISLGTDESKIAIDGVTKLADRSIELEKLRIQEEDLAEKRNMDYELRSEQIKKEHLRGMIDIGTKVLIGLGGLALSVWGTIYTTNFEREDNYTTSASRSWISSLFKPKRRD